MLGIETVSENITEGESKTYTERGKCTWGKKPQMKFRKWFTMHIGQETMGYKVGHESIIQL